MFTPTLASSTEELFPAHAGSGPTPANLLGWGGAALLGAAWQASRGPESFARWAGWLGLLGLLAVLVAWWLGRSTPPVVRVGSAGIALERGEEVHVLPWYRVAAVDLVDQHLLLSGEQQRLAVPLRRHAAAAQRILEELKERRNEQVEVAEAVGNSVREASRKGSAQPAQVPARRHQQAGVKCLASGRTISFEADVVACARCAAPYHREQVPDACQVCGASQWLDDTTATRT